MKKRIFIFLMTVYELIKDLDVCMQNFATHINENSYDTL